MASVITLAPIAGQLARSFTLNDLFPRDAVEQALGGAEQPGEPKLPDDIRPFLEHYWIVVRGAVQLLGAPAFDVLARLQALKNGWFSVLRIDRVHLDKGLEVFDLFRQQELRISERAATRQVGSGDLILGWLCKDPGGALTLEGALARVPALAAGPLEPFVAALRRAMPPLVHEKAWKRATADLPLPLIAAIIELRANPPRGA